MRHTIWVGNGKKGKKIKKISFILKVKLESLESIVQSADPSEENAKSNTLFTFSQIICLRLMSQNIFVGKIKRRQIAMKENPFLFPCHFAFYT